MKRELLSVDFEPTPYWWKVRYSSTLNAGFALLVAVFALVFFTRVAHAESAAEEEVWEFSVGSESGSIARMPASEIHRETIQVSGRPLHFVEIYKDQQKIPKHLVLIVHGTPGGWDDQIPFLSDESLRDAYHLIAVDRLGHGQSTGDIEPSLEVQAASLKSLMDRVTSGKGVILVGHSLGGPIVARTAMDYPENIVGLVFIAATADPAYSRKWYNLVGGVPPIRWLLPQPLERANQEILPLKKQLTAMEPRWKNIRVPTAIIQGGKDRLVDPRNAQFIQRSLVNAPVTMVLEPEEDHFLHWQRPQLLIDVLTAFASD